MIRRIAILFSATLIVALPFLFQSRGEATDKDALTLVIVTPHNEAIRYEFGRAFSAWHERHYGQPVRVDWRAIGGATEIARYLASEYMNAARAWWKARGQPWPQGASEELMHARLSTNPAPGLAELHRTFRATDDPRAFSSRIDLYFGGGEYDHSRAAGQGLTVAPWAAGREPTNLFFAADGTPLLPERISGEVWRTPTLFGTAVSTFGICYNEDRLADLGMSHAPSRWDDLADPRLFRQVGVSDPTKSGSIAKAFELIIQQKCKQAVTAAGFTEQQIAQYEQAIAGASLPPGQMPPQVPAAYQQAVEQGWVAGLALVQKIGANARYFTDSASKVPVDVGMGNAAAGLCIDFYGRFEAQSTRGPDGHARMKFIVPAGGSGASADPISLLRGAEHRELAVRFIEFVLGEDGQKIWCYRPGTPGGPHRYALHRIPIRRDFFASDQPVLQARHLAHCANAADDLADPNIDPYLIAANFQYNARWTIRHFNILRDLIRAMCIDASEELQSAWPEVATLPGLPVKPEPVTWTSALSMNRRWDRMQLLEEWTSYYRAGYEAAREAPR